MALRTVEVLSVLLPSAFAIAFPSTTPTPTPSLGGQPPLPALEPTPAVQGHAGVLRPRQSDVETESYWFRDHPDVCGWVNGDYNNYQIACATTATCVYHASNVNFAGMLGCCTGSSCQFQTVCIDSSQISASPQLTETRGALSLYCDSPDSPICATYVYSDISVTDFGCDSTTDYPTEVYTTGWDSSSTGSVSSRYDLYLTTAGDDLISSYTSAFAASQSQDQVPTSSAQPTASETQHTSSSTGAIAGGVVGGVAGVALIVAAAIFLLRRRKNKQAQAGAASTEHGGSSYQSVPNSSSPNGYPMQGLPAEMESKDAAHKFPEAEGSYPAAITHEMDGSTTNKGDEGEIQSRDFLAELPADSIQPAKK